MRVRCMILVLATAFLGFSVSGYAQFQATGKQHNIVKLLEAVGDSAGSRLGVSVAGIGDQNGDGYDDIIAAATGDEKAYLYYGGSPMDSIPDMVFNGMGEDKIGGRLSYAKDVNGDRGSDFMIKISRYHTEKPSAIYIYFGGSLLDTIPDVVLVGESFGDAFGSCFSTAGDVNGDGYDDVIVAAVNYPNEMMQGKVYIYFGGPDMDSLPDWTVVGDSAHFRLGENVSGGVDINGDSYDDVLISGCTDTPSPSYFRVYFGGQPMDTIPDFVLSEAHLSYNINPRVSVIGDVNADEYADIICGGSYKRIWKAYVFYGGQKMDTIPDVTLEGVPEWYGPEGPFSHAGDINRDGYADVIAGNPRGFGDLGAVLVYLGGRIMNGKLDVGFTGFRNPYKGCGKSVGRAGDVNGDGIDDILFGAPGLYHPPYWYSEGRVMVFSGDTTLSYVKEEKGGFELPREVSLGQNFPNPFNATTIINYELRIKNSPVYTILKIYNLLGQEVRTLVDKLQKGGRYEVSWDGKDEEGREVGSGIYFYQLTAQSQKGGVAQKTRKLLLIR